MTIKAIETVYKGYPFRSRLEARWAVFFEALGVSFDYEPEGYKIDNAIKYLPDFYIPEWDMYIEIKGDPLETVKPDNIHKWKRFAEARKKPLCVFSGPIRPYQMVNLFFPEYILSLMDRFDHVVGHKVFVKMRGLHYLVVFAYGIRPPIIKIIVDLYTNDLERLRRIADGVEELPEETFQEDLSKVIVFPLGKSISWPLAISKPIKSVVHQDDGYICEIDDDPRYKRIEIGNEGNPILVGYNLLKIGNFRLKINSRAYELARQARFEHGKEGYL